MADEPSKVKESDAGPIYLDDPARWTQPGETDGGIVVPTKVTAAEWRAPESVRWRNDHGRVVGGFLSREQPDSSTYRIHIPNWIDGTTETVTVDRSRCLLGNVPWPNDR